MSLERLWADALRVPLAAVITNGELGIARTDGWFIERQGPWRSWRDSLVLFEPFSYFFQERGCNLVWCKYSHYFRTFHHFWMSFLLIQCNPEYGSTFGARAGDSVRYADVNNA